MSDSKIQIILPTDKDMKALGIQKEIEQTKPTIHKKADENYYSSTLGPTLGKAIHSVIAGRNRERVKAFENTDFQYFFKKVFAYVEKRAHELGCLTSEVEFSKDSGITRDGTLLLKIVKKIDKRGI